MSEGRTLRRPDGRAPSPGRKAGRVPGSPCVDGVVHPVQPHAGGTVPLRRLVRLHRHGTGPWPSREQEPGDTPAVEGCRGPEAH